MSSPAPTQCRSAVIQPGRSDESPHLLGIAVGRYILGIPSLVTMDDDTLARWLKPVLTHYLTDPAP